MSILTLGQYAAALTACGAFIGLLIKWLVVVPIKAYIDQMTYPIQPTSNGGNSLPDVIRTLERIENKVISLDARLLVVERDTPKPPF